MDCRYCSDVRDGGEFFIAETKYWKVFLNTEQTYLCRCYIPLKRHCERVSDLTKAEWEDLRNTVKKLEKGIRSAASPTLFNWVCLMNNSYQTKPSHPHVHWHCIPRYRKTPKFAGMEFEDVEFGHNFNSKLRRDVSTEVKLLIAEEIRSSIK